MASKGGLAWFDASSEQCVEFIRSGLLVQGNVCIKRTQIFFAFCGIYHHFAGHSVAKLKLKTDRRSKYKPCKLQHTNAGLRNWCL